jgi:hypothetical protein
MIRKNKEHLVPLYRGDEPGLQVTRYPFIHKGTAAQNRLPGLSL